LSSSDIQVQHGKVPPRLPTTPSGDPGDETERNFRYQHQYGVVLLAAMRRGALNYVSLYCEHHEDFLAERPDGLFDGYQIKTQRPENGAWTLKSAALTKSIGRFVDLMAAFPSQIGRFVFVSNSDVDAVTPISKDDKRRGLCPGLMLDHVKSCSDADAVQPPFRRPFDALAAELGVGRSQLFEVLRKLETVKGPSREDFDAALAQEHIGGLPECAHLALGPLREICNDLVAKFHRAASLYVVDPDRYLATIASGSTLDPKIAAKRIVIADLAFAPPSNVSETFRYHGAPTISLGQPRKKRILEQKLERGGVSPLIDYMKAREQAAEYHFLEEQAKDSVRADLQLRQVEEAVHGECIESFMAHQAAGAQFGQPMFNGLTVRLRNLEAQRKDLLGGTPYEVLMGTAALLTNDCRVWWSERFQIEESEG
jgi:hypothetical protein